MQLTRMHSRRRLIFLPWLLGLFWLLTGISECASPDEDLDGWTEADGDCDDNNAAIHPEAIEACDGMDTDCDGILDPSFVWYSDEDKDGAGDPLHPSSACLAPTGTVGNAEDCNDSDPAYSPSAQDICDLKDNDCDGVIDEHLPSYRYRDLDGDGFGDQTHVMCQDTPGYVVALGDCNDSNASIHPGAIDPADDGVDQDCGGTTGQEPSLGYPGSKQTTLAQALSLAAEGTTLWIGPGTWPSVGLSISSISLSIRSSHRAEDTILTGQDQGRLLLLSNTSGVHLDGLTLAHGSVIGNGGALSALNSLLTLTGCQFDHNIATYGSATQTMAGLGGALYLENSIASISQSVFQSNQSNSTRFTDAEGQSYVGGGGAIAAVGGELSLTNTLLSSNQVASLEGSYGQGYGSTLWAVEAPITLEETIIQKSDGWSAVNSFGSTLTLSNTTIADGGGGVFAGASTIKIESSSFRNLLWGGVMLNGTAGQVSDSEFDNIRESAVVINYTPSNQQVTLSRNLIHGSRTNRLQGAIDVDGGTVFLSHNTIIGNATRYGGVAGESCTLTLRSNILAHNVGYNLFVDPDYPCSVDAKDNTLFTPSGRNYNNGTLDSSNSFQDPLFIRYLPSPMSEDEDLHLRASSPVKHGSDGSQLNADGSVPEQGRYIQTFSANQYYADSDQDGLYDGWELLNGSSATVSDATSDPDHDGLSQAAELSNGTLGLKADSDLDGASDGKEVSVGSLPLDWYTQPATDGGVTEAVARVPGDFPSIQSAIDAIWLTGKIEAAPGPWNEPLWVSDRTVTLRGEIPSSPLVLDGTNDHIVMQVIWGEVDIANAVIQNGIAVEQYTPGGLFVLHSTATLQQILFAENTGFNDGGGLGSISSSVSLEDVQFVGNMAAKGAALNADRSECVFDGLEVSENVSAGPGNVFLSYSSLTGTHLLVLHNQSNAQSPGIHAYQSQIDITQALLMDNSSSDAKGAGALELEDSTGSLHFAAVINNTALTYGGGIRLWGNPNQSLALENTVVAYNSPANVYTTDMLGGTTVPMPISARYSDLYNPPGSMNFNYLSPGSSYQVLEPGFLRYANGRPQNPHLASGSKLINAGDPMLQDVDGTRADMGMFGGQAGAEWDVDEDGLPGYFWPGEFSNTPVSINAASYDADDLTAVLP